MSTKSRKRAPGGRKTAERRSDTPSEQSPGDPVAMMKAMMPEMMKGMSVEDMMSMMGEMMPKMMDQCAQSMSGAQMGEAMHEMVPKMMESCFAKMDPEQRASMFSMCRTMLDDMEKRF